MSRVSAYPSRPPSRPPSEQLCDLHVYKVPLELWRAPLNNILNQSVTDTISLGIIRVPPDIALIDIRSEIQRQLEELVPKDYVFLRSVGRSITRLKTKQEYQLKAKHFLPPVHYAPELFILEATPEIRDALAISDRSSQQSPNSMNRGSPGGRSYRDGYRTYRDRNGYPERKLLEELEEAKSTRHITEKEREDLVKKAKILQNKTQNRRNQARDVWKKRYFEEKKKTPPLEEQTNRLQEELEALHRKLMAALEGPKEKSHKLGDARPSQKSNYVIQCTKLQHDIDDLKRRVENAKMKLTAEMKLRTQAETELRAVRAEAVQKKIHMRGQAFQVY